MQTLYRMISIGSAINQWHRGKSGRIATDWKDFKDLCNIICGHFLYYDSNQFRKIWKIRKNYTINYNWYHNALWLRMGHIIKNQLLKYERWKLYNLGVVLKKKKIRTNHK